MIEKTNMQGLNTQNLSEVQPESTSKLKHQVDACRDKCESKQAAVATAASVHL